MADQGQMRLDKLETLLAVNRELALELDLDKLLELIASAACRVMDADRSSVYVVDRTHNELWTRVAQGIDEIRMPLGRGIAGRVATSGEVLNVVDAYLVPDFDATWDQKHGYTTRTMLCVPLRGRSGDIIGVFAVLNKHVGAFDAEDEALLEALGAGVAIALENALLIDELKATNRKLSEAYDQVLLSEKLSMLGLLAGTLAHDIQNPLAVILGNAEILQALFADEERLIQGTTTIVRQTERISALVDSIQNYSRGDAETFGPVDVHLVLRESLMLTERLLSQTGVEVVQNYSELPQVFGNANRLEQVFMNLIQNAAQAMEDKNTRRLVIETQTLEREDGVWVEVSIADTGGGVPAEKEVDIFKAFFTTKSKDRGTGLGLAICQRIIRAHGGELELLNRRGEGATFVARIAAGDRQTDKV